MQKDWMERALDMARLIGMTDLAPVEDIYIDAVQAGADDGVSLALGSRSALDAQSNAGEGSDPADAARMASERQSMTRFQLIAIRLLLLALVLGAWEVLPRNGVINPLLLPPLGDVLAMLVELLGRPQVHEAIAGHGGGGDRRLHHRGAARRRDRRADRRERLCRADLQAAAVLRVQRAEIDLPADVHPDHAASASSRRSPTRRSRRCSSSS